MKIQANRVDDFIKHPEPNARGVLIYGSDLGLVLLRKQEFLQTLIPNYKHDMSLVQFDGSTIKDKPGVIENEYYSSSLFFTGRRVILVEDGENSITKTLETMFNAPKDSDNFIVITAGDLNARSSLRLFAEYNKYFAALPCYKDDTNTVIQTITSKLRANGFTFQTDAIKYLADNLGGDRLVILNEIDKLMIYKDTNKALTMEDVEACVKDSSESNVMEFVNYLALLNFEKAFKKLQNLYSDGTYPVIIIHTAINHFIKLQLIKYRLQHGDTFDDVAKDVNIFWKDKVFVQQQLQKLTYQDINRIIHVLSSEESRLKGKV